MFSPFWNQPISVMALPKIAEMEREHYPSAVDIIINNPDVDNLVGSKRTKEETLDLARDTELILGFTMKHWMMLSFGKTAGVRIYTDQFLGNEDPAKTNDHINCGPDIEKAED